MQIFGANDDGLVFLVTAARLLTNYDRAKNILIDGDRKLLADNDIRIAGAPSIWLRLRGGCGVRIAHRGTPANASSATVIASAGRTR